MPEKEKTEKEKRKWQKVNVAREALIKKYADTSFMRMPDNSEYAGYTYNLYNNRIKEGRQITDLQSDTRELCYEVIIAENESIRLTNKNKEVVTLTGKEFSESVGGTSSKDYSTKTADGEKQWFSVSLPQEAMLGMYENAALFQLPDKEETAGFSYYIPNVFVSEDEESEDGRIVLRLPEDFEINAKNRQTGEIIELTAYQLFGQCNDTQAEDYSRKNSDGADSNNEGWNKIEINENAKVAEYGERTLFKMPKGEYEGFFYYIPNKLIDYYAETNTPRLNLPDDFIITVSDNKSGEKTELSVEDFLSEVENKTDADYMAVYQKPSDSKAEKFLQREKNLITNIPEEMKARPNWCIVRTKDNTETGRLEKYIVDCNTGKHARIDDHATWTDFKTACEYAKQNGGDALAYALDGKDKICCIDFDKCIDEENRTSALANDFINRSRYTYSEYSVSGKGIHIFGKTDGLDVRAFSKDGDLEFYQKGQFITVTGDAMSGDKNLLNIDKTDMKPMLERKCAKRTEWKGIGKGVEGLSSMPDRDVVEKACKAKHGDTFKALYDGNDLQNNRSNSDMSLMNRLAFWCNGDKEQMLRVFATSGLFRKEKSPDYYECTAIKAIRDTTGRFQPQTGNNAGSNNKENKKPSGNNGNGKR